MIPIPFSSTSSHKRHSGFPSPGASHWKRIENGLFQDHAVSSDIRHCADHAGLESLQVRRIMLEPLGVFMLSLLLATITTICK